MHEELDDGLTTVRHMHVYPIPYTYMYTCMHMCTYMFAHEGYAYQCMSMHTSSQPWRGEAR